MVDALLAGRWLLALVLLCAGLGKLADRANFAETIRRYAVAPEAAVPALAVLVPGVEFALGLMLAAGVAPVAGGSSAGLLMLGFAGVIAVNLARGRRFDCGCGGAGGGEIGWPLLLRDLALGAIGVAVALGPAGLALWPGPAAAGAHVPATALLPVPLAVIAVFVLGRCVRSLAITLSAGPVQWGDRR